ncbi:LysR substrate-binding domain-containing protein [Escherichia coli]|nr:LysR family transcriptional regulator [Escherichia coli]
MKYIPKLQQIKFFNEIVLCGSLRAAARKMNISQPALSRSIKELENILGCNLLIRTRDGVILTEAGKIFLVHSRMILEEVETAALEVAKVNIDNTGKVAFGISSLFGVTILNNVLDNFRKKYQKTRVMIREGQLSSLIPFLREGVLDFAMGTLTKDMPVGDFIVVELFNAPFTVVARKHHPLRNCTSIDELVTARWVFPETQMGYYHYISGLIPFGHPDETYAPIFTDSVVCIMNLVLYDDYITVLSRARLQEARFKETLCSIPVRYQLPVSQYGLIYPRKRLMTTPVQIMIEYFQQEIQRYDWNG